MAIRPVSEIGRFFGWGVKGRSKPDKTLVFRDLVKKVAIFNRLQYIVDVTRFGGSDENLLNLVSNNPPTSLKEQNPL